MRPDPLSAPPFPPSCSPSPEELWPLDHLRESLIWDEPRTRLTWVYYDGYPGYRYQDDRYQVFLEGCLYGLAPDRLPRELAHLADLLWSAAPQALPDWYTQIDGDFLIVIRRRRDGALAVLNDAFGRLPTYYCAVDQGLVLARDLAWVAAHLPAAALDCQALAHYLLLGFLPGPDTWFTGIATLPPGTLLQMLPGHDGPAFIKVHAFDLTSQPEAGERQETQAARLAGLFRAACVRRLPSSGPVFVSLSGGLDSRAVAAGFASGPEPVHAVSFLAPQEANHDDVAQAAQVAATLRLPWEVYPLPPPRGCDLQQLLELKAGLNTLRLGFILDFFRRLRQAGGPSCLYVTGDGGGDCLGDSRPYRPVNSLTALTDYIIARYQVFSPATVATLTGITPRDLWDGLARHLEVYPETAPVDKYRRFYALEVAVKEYNEGEDRNRHFFWSVSPFYARDFFTAALTSPPVSKAGYCLYAAFLRELHPALPDLLYADWQAPLTSRRFRLSYALKSHTRRYPQLIRALRRLTGRYATFPPDSNLIRFLTAQAAASPVLGDYLDLDCLRALLAQPQRATQLQWWNLLTLVAVIDRFAGPATAWKTFQTVPFP